MLENETGFIISRKDKRSASQKLKFHVEKDTARITKLN